MTPKPTPPRIAIQEFATILAAAVHDVQHELAGDAKVVHFWDADSLFYPIRGFLGVMDAAPFAQSLPDRLVQALFAAGYLGRVYLLRPHRDELFGLLDKWYYEEKQDRRDRSSLRKQFLEKEELQEVRELASFIEMNSPLNETSARGAIARLRTLGSGSFVAFEALGGTLASRFKRMTSGSHLLDIASHGATTTEILNDPNFDLLANDLSKLRQGRSPLSTALDAASLLILTYLNADSRVKASRVYPRFFTSSQNLKRLYANSRFLQDSLAYEYHTDGSRRKTGSVWRTAEYYYLRAIFPALRLGGATAVEEAEGGPSYVVLSELSQELSDALEKGHGDAEKLVNDFIFEEDMSSLAGLLEDMKSLRMSRIWLSYSSSTKVPFVRNTVRLFTDLKLVDDDLGILSHFETHVRRDIQQILTARSIGARMATAVQASIYEFKAARRDGRLLLSSDLAGLRWGVFAGSRPDDIISLGLENESDDRNGSWSQRDLLRIFSLDDLRESVAQSERMCAILIGLEQFDLASELIKLVGDAVSSPSLELMAIVSRLGTRGPLTETHLRLTFDLLGSRWLALNEADRLRLVVGYAYAATSAWERSGHGGAWSIPRLRGGAEWAAWGVNLLLEYMDRVDVELKIYCINQLLYTSTRAGIEVPDAAALLADLELQADRRDEFRFLDTVGYCLMKQVEREEAINLDSCSRLERAIDYLSRARELVPRDIEVMQHWEAALDLGKSLGCRVSPKN